MAGVVVLVVAVPRARRAGIVLLVVTPEVLAIGAVGGAAGAGLVELAGRIVRR